MRTTVRWDHLQLRKLGHVLAITLAGLVCASSALADEEVSNVAHVVAGPYGRCYAKSVPAKIYDLEGEPRQQGRTTLYHVGDGRDATGRPGRRGCRLPDRI